MAGFLFDVGTRFDQAGVDAFVAKVKAAIAQIASEGGTAAPARLTEVQTAASSGLATLRESGAGAASLNVARRELTQALRASTTALFDEITSGRKLTAAQSRAAEELLALSGANISGKGRTSLPVSNLREAGAFLSQRREEVFKNLSPADVAYAGIPTELRAAGAEKVRMARLGINELAGETADARKLRIATATRVVTENIRTARAQQALAAESEEVTAIVQRMVAERRLNRELNARVAAEIRNRSAAGESEFQGSLFQRLQASTASRAGQAPRLPTEFATLGQFVTSKALTTAGFAVAGVGLYAGIQAIKDIIEQSGKLQTQLQGIRAQFEATDRAGEFPAFRQAILDISRETGTLSTEVAALGPLFVGAYGDGERAATELRSAVIGIKAGAFTKEDAANISNALTSTFRELGLSVANITDQGLHLQDVFGPASDEILRATANLAPVAKEVGLTFQETSTIIAAATQAAGAPATSVAEGLNRILPEIQANAAQILNVYQQTTSLRPKLPQIGQLLGEGKTGAVLLELVRDYNLLGDAQQKQVISSLGGRREAQSLIPLLNQSVGLVRELDHGTEAAGRTQAGFNRVMESVAEQFKKLGEAMRQIGQDLLRAGLAGLLHDVAIAGGVLVTVLAELVGFLGDINDLTHGWGARIIEVVLAYRLLSPLLRGLLASRGGLGGLASSAVGAVAPGRNAGALLPGSAGYQLPVAGATAPGGRLARLGSGALALAGGPAGLAVTAGTLLTGAYVNQYSQSQAETARLREELKTADEAKIHKAAEDHDNAVAEFINGIFGKKPPAEIAKEEINRRAAQPLADDLGALQRGSQVGIHEGERDRLLDKLRHDAASHAPGAGEAFSLVKDATSGKDDYSEIIKGVQEGDKASILAAQAIVDQYRQRPGFDQTLSKAHADLASQLTAAQQKEASENGQALADIQTVVQEYEAGGRSLGSTLEALRATIALYESIPEDRQTAEFKKLVAAARKSESSVSSKALREAADLRIELGDVGGTAGPEAKVDEYTRLLADPKFNDKGERTKTAHDLAKAEQDLLTKTADLADAGADRARILRDGLALPDAARQVLAIEQLDLSSEYTTFRDRFVSIVQGVGESFDRDVADLINAGRSIREAIVEVLQRQLQNALSQLSGFFDIEGLAKVADIQGAIANIPANLPGVSVPGRVSSEAGAAAAEKGGAGTNDLAAARRQLAKAQAHGDPVLQAQNELAAANEELAAAVPGSAEEIRAQARVLESQDSLDDAYADITKARLELAKAQVGDDAVAQARIAQNEAAQAAASARGEAERVRAEAQRIDANRSLAKAIADVFNSETELAIAVAEAAGDTVKAAQLGAREAQDKLNQAISQGAGAGEINRLQADVVRANAQARDANVSEQERKIDFALEIGRITTQEAVAQLKGLLALVAGNEQATDEILLKIHQLMKAASQDLQFNIPQDITLPTLYEARRLNQSNQAGIGYQGNREYQDNRRITLQMNVTKDTDYQAAFDQFRGIAVEPSLQFGTQGSLYSGA